MPESALVMSEWVACCLEQIRSLLGWGMLQFDDWVVGHLLYFQQLSNMLRTLLSLVLNIQLHVAKENVYGHIHSMHQQIVP